MAEETMFFKSAFSVDNVIFGFGDGDLKVLLIERGEEPFNGKWALPGDLVYPNEDIDSAATRVLKELTGLANVYLEQVKAFGAVERHPLGRVITIAYYSLIKISSNNLKTSSFAKKVKWHAVNQIEELAFDHLEILTASFSILKKSIRNRPIGFELLPPKFTLTQLQHLYEAVLEAELDKRNFRKKILSMGLLEDIGEMQVGVAHRPAKLYRFDKSKYELLMAEGFVFELSDSKKLMGTSKSKAS